MTGASGRSFISNRAPIAWLASMLTRQVPCSPEHAPDHPANFDPLAGLATSFTFRAGVAGAKSAVHAVASARLQLSLRSESPVTVPAPPPLTSTVSLTGGGGGGAFCAKVAITLRFASMATVQSESPEQAPSHPEKVDFESGLATSFTTRAGVAPSTATRHCASDAREQLSLSPLPSITVPAPSPFSSTTRTRAGGGGAAGVIHGWVIKRTTTPAARIAAAPPPAMSLIGSLRAGGSSPPPGVSSSSCSRSSSGPSCSTLGCATGEEPLAARAAGRSRSDGGFGVG